MSALRRAGLRALAIPAAAGAQSRRISWPAARCTGDNMRCNWLSKRDYQTLADDCGVPEVCRPAIGVSDEVSLPPSTHFRCADKGRVAVEFGRFIDETDGVAQAKQLFDLLSAFALNFGCTRIAYGRLTTDRKVLKPVRCDSEEILNYPDEWQERCLEMGYDRIAPVIKESRMRAGPIRWSEVYSDASTTEYDRRIFDEAATYGLRSGVTVPLQAPDGSFAIISFAQHCGREFQNKTINYLQLAAIHFHLRVVKVANSNVIKTVPHLSKREKECILWVARGKSSWDIGTIMSISANTVNFHIKNVMRKLDAASRTVAAMKAISLGIIEL
ncbi:LuxR family transcriptional regulator [Rhizobium sp. SEMIA 4085]|uniref:LuxR family transcriptional regulator protein n=1 Tax=Rhizobium gallicum bv. gallicum R602sp TaxID=1041138 RepID=A0A0B4XAQ8_9HYPH|nr:MULTISPECIES: LuxR family transcriptional regulator [Rhizobium]AJD43835.1 LuxR family transcriptional regulator protein [Rhizobium gallicum bv. gallicum R602sp]NNH32191.1 LuxR family transcriptional regulator [Rhizobium sp. SEMIA 4085]TDW34318.1 LuxR family quorum-sensing system transcriptional regulator CciR [Rhizobium azibense]